MGEWERKERKKGSREEEEKEREEQGKAAVQFPLNFARTKVQAKAIEEAPSRHTLTLPSPPLSLYLFLTQVTATFDFVRGLAKQASHARGGGEGQGRVALCGCC